MKAEGAELADQLRRQAMALSYSKATEFSPKIPLYCQLAAQVALLVYWPDREACEAFEQGIRCYRNFESTQAVVDEYESFRLEYVGDVSDA